MLLLNNHFRHHSILTLFCDLLTVYRDALTSFKGVPTMIFGSGKMFSSLQKIFFVAVEITESPGQCSPLFRVWLL